MRLLPLTSFVILAACGAPGSEQQADHPETKNEAAMQAAADNTLTEAEKNEGWQLLFDGQTRAGWHGYQGRSDAGWKAEDGTLFLDTAGGEIGASLVTDREFENFHLKLDWKISPGGNSGILFGVREQEGAEDYYSGPEMQVLDDAGFPHPVTDKQKSGALYDLIASSAPQAVKPVGEWNTAEIIKNGDSLEFRLNGPTVVQTKMWDDNWSKMVAGSKFKEWPVFGTLKSGKISLQDHGSAVWYKNIKVKTW